MVMNVIDVFLRLAVQSLIDIKGVSVRFSLGCCQYKIHLPDNQLVQFCKIKCICFLALCLMDLQFPELTCAFFIAFYTFILSCLLAMVFCWCGSSVCKNFRIQGAEHFCLDWLHVSLLWLLVLFSFPHSIYSRGVKLKHILRLISMLSRFSRATPRILHQKCHCHLNYGGIDVLVSNLPLKS